MEQPYECLIAGAGMAGAVAARTLAERGGLRVRVLERRDHIGGNAYDCLDPSGIRIHRYGPHIFHTDSKRVYDFLCRFTAFSDYQHQVAANLPDGQGGRMEYPVPFNLSSLETAFGPKEGKRLGEKLLAAYGPEKKVTILELRQNPDPEVSALADYVYDHVFVRYTMKQWGQTPEEIDPGTTARVPVFLSRDSRYFQDAYQGMPTQGYTAMFERMLDHPNITVELGTDARDRLDLSGDRVRLDGAPFAGLVLYTGAVDELFDLVYGRLPYRTLDFVYETWRARTGPGEPWPDEAHPLRVGDFYQSHATVNYTMDEDFTRITEFKRLTGQTAPGVTTIMKEYARTYTGAPGEIPYYAVISPENNALYGRYRDLAARFPNLHLLGRLAEYKYYNMDAIALRALELCDRLLEEGARHG